MLYDLTGMQLKLIQRAFMIKKFCLSMGKTMTCVIAPKIYSILIHTFFIIFYVGNGG